MNIHFENLSNEEARLGELIKAPVGESIDVCDVALAFIHERTQLLKLLRAHSACEEPNDVFNSIRERLERLEQVSEHIQFALHDVMFAGDRLGEMKSARKNQGRAYSREAAPAAR